MPAPGRSLAGDDRPTFLTGAYCIENELLSWRSLRFPHGIAAGDLVVWPNTAGYFMHFLESRSHQFPLARNLVLEPAATEAAVPSVEVDLIDDPPS